MAGLGLGSTTTRFIAQFAVVDPPRAGRIVALVTLVSWGTISTAAVVVIVASSYISRVVLNAPHLRSALVWGTLLLAAMTLRGIQSGTLAGLERFNIIAKLNVLEGVASLVAMVALAGLMGVDGALLGMALGYAVTWVSGRVALKRAFAERGIVVCYAGCARDWRILASYSLPALLANVVATPILWLSMAFLARTEHGYAALGTYNAAYQWHGPVVFIPMILMSVTLPILVQEWEGGRLASFRKVTFGTCGLMLVITLPAVILLGISSSWIMGLYGHRFEEGWVVLALLAAAAPLHALAKIAAGALFAMNRAWSVLGANIAWGATLLALVVPLVPELGAIGLGVAFLAAHFVAAAILSVMVLFGTRAPIQDAVAADIANV
jgi:O-antigen/teichoic acid export membrane protein